MNIDGAFFAESKSGAWGFVVGDPFGRMVLAGAGNISPVHNALMAETKQCKKRRGMALLELKLKLILAC